jgi:hypothetical protein
MYNTNIVPKRHFICRFGKNIVNALENKKLVHEAGGKNIPDHFRDVTKMIKKG